MLRHRQPMRRNRDCFVRQRLLLPKQNSGPNLLLFCMKRWYPHLWLACALLALLPLAARATTVIAPSFDRMVDTSDYIVRATVKSVTSEWRDNPDKPGQRY